MSEKYHYDRRRFLGAAVSTVAAGGFLMTSIADAQARGIHPADAADIKPSTTSMGKHTSFGPLKQIDAGLLNVGYAEVVPPAALRSYFCTAGLRYLQFCGRRSFAGSKGVSGDCALSARLWYDPFFFQETRFAMASSLSLRSISSRSWMR